jgi:phosphoadenosine phosphosulfate reductase
MFVESEVLTKVVDPLSFLQGDEAGGIPSAERQPLRPVAGSRSALLLQTLTTIARDHAPAVFSTSLSAEDMVITDVILRANLDIEIFAIDTGRLHADTLELLDAIRQRYDHPVRIYTPDAAAAAQYVASHGRDAFYESAELRHECCRIRKVEPLNRALAGKRGWVTGLRRASSAARGSVAEQQYDSAHDLVKFNPLAEWSEKDVWDYVWAHQLPYNRLYENGYRSIGCAPCTRPVVAGEDERAGRWWWEQNSAKECGLHVQEQPQAHTPQK